MAIQLRYTYATLLLAAGVHPTFLQERLGHSQIGITLDTYSHVVPTMQLEAARKLDVLLRPSRSPPSSATLLAVAYSTRTTLHRPATLQGPQDPPV